MLPRGCRPRLAWMLAVLSLFSSPLGLPAAPAQLSRRTATPPPEKIALFGIDAGDWRAIDRLVAAGRLPWLGRLERLGLKGVLEADPPLLSPIIWTTIATGRRPEDHGVLDFMVDRPGGGQAPVSGGARRVKALWEIWSDAGRRVLVTGWWATWPADQVRGVIASDRIATPHIAQAVRPDAGLVSPASRLPDVARLIVEPDSIDYDTLSRLIPLTRAEYDRARAAGRQQSPGALYRDRIAHFRAAIAATRTYRQISTQLIPTVRPDFWAAYYEVVDTASHLFASDPARAERAVASAYQEVDAALGDTARALDPDTLVVVLSDHGFQPSDAGIREDPADLTAGATAWHRPYGIIAAVKAGVLAGSTGRPEAAISGGQGTPPATAPEGIQPGVAVGIVSPLDVAPTVLARAGLAVAADMPGRVIAALAPAAAPARIASYGAHRLPDAAPPNTAGARAEIERLRALGYVSGAGAVTSLARVNLGEILFRKGDLPGAVRELEAVLRADPLNTHAALWLARAYEGMQRRDEAEAIYDRMVQASVAASAPLDPVAVLAATDLDLSAGRPDAAQARLGRLPNSVVGAPEVRVATAAVAEAQGRAPAAERGYREALASAPSDFDALQRLMDLLLRQKRTQEAASVTTAAARRFPASPQHLSLAGEAALAARRPAEAERWFARALQLAPGARSVRLDLARSQLLGGRADAALLTLGQEDGSREAEMLRGAALSARRAWPAAIAAFERALHAGPPAADLLTALAAAQVEAGRRAEAVRSLEESLRLQPNQPEARALLARVRGQ